jgi:leucyl aminopeptidase (aminopeptidase T)
LSGRKRSVFDGVITDDDIREENFSDGLPAGKILAAPLEESAHGNVAFNVRVPYLGRNVERLLA